MHLNKRYRQLVALFLLLVYAFIATPVQLWHDHDTAKGSVQSAGQKQSSFTNGTKLFNDSNCPVCHHQYSTYHNDFIFPVVPNPCEFSSQNGYYTLRFVYSPFFSFQNKGPPFLA